jgi:tRNA(fMet)-specific endonuclease VapC
MALYVLDTDILTLYQLGNSAVCQQVAMHSPDQLAVTIISVEEQLSGWYTLRRRVKKRDQLAYVYERFSENVRFLSQLNVISFTEPAIERFESLLAMKLQVKAMDLRIAAIALDRQGTVVTRNLRDFQRIPSLTVENWVD